MSTNTILFIKFTSSGNLIEAQQYYSSKIALKKCEKVFRLACHNGHLEVAQWLLTVKPTIDISAENDNAFRYACYYRHLNVAQWFISLLPYKYNVVIENNKIVAYNVRQHLPLTNKFVSLYYSSNEDIICSICYDDNKIIEIQTNCKHNFCKDCINTYYLNSIYKFNLCKCPYCRIDITSCNTLQLINTN